MLGPSGWVAARRTSKVNPRRRPQGRLAVDCLRVGRLARAERRSRRRDCACACPPPRVTRVRCPFAAANGAAPYCRVRRLAASGPGCAERGAGAAAAPSQVRSAVPAGAWATAGRSASRWVPGGPEPRREALAGDGARAAVAPLTAFRPAGAPQALAFEGSRLPCKAVPGRDGAFPWLLGCPSSPARGFPRSGGPPPLPAGIGEEKKEEPRKVPVRPREGGGRGFRLGDKGQRSQDAKSKRDKRALGPLDLLRAPIGISERGCFASGGEPGPPGALFRRGPFCEACWEIPA